MKTLISVCVLFLIVTGEIMAQTVSVQPYFGYSTVRMSEANNDMVVRVNQLRRFSQQFIPSPDPLNGNYTWGVGVTYRFEDDYFATVKTLYFSEKTGKDYRRTAVDYPLDFHFDRDIRFFDFTIGLQYFFNYSSWKRINYYLGAGAGLGLGWSRSNFTYQDNNPAINNIDSRGDFSGSAMTAHFALGLTLRVLPPVFLSAEGGYRFANLRQLEGQLKLSGVLYPNYVTESSYDFSGFYITIGTGFILPIFE